MEEHPDIHIIAVPYDSGHLRLRMGAGPEHLLDTGLDEALRPEGRRPSVTIVRHEREPTAEVATAFELQGLVSARVRRALADGEFPLVLSGNCNTAVGTLSGALDALRAGVDRVYVHLDLDVLDAEDVGEANEFAAKGGPNGQELQAALGTVRERFEVAALGIASYDPTFDADGRVLRAAVSSARSLSYPTGPPPGKIGTVATPRQAERREISR